MYSKKFIVGLISTTFLFGCGQNAFVESDAGSIEALRAEKSLTPNTAKIIKKESQLSVLDVNLGQVEVGSMVRVPIEIKNLGREEIKKIVFKADSSDLSRFELLEELKQGEIKKLFLDLKISEEGDKVYASTARFLVNEEVKEVLFNINVKGTLSSKEANLEFHRFEDKKLVFDAIPLKSLGTKEVLIVNKSDKTAIIENILIDSGENYSYELQPLKGSQESCKRMIKNSCLLVVKFNPKERFNLRDRLNIIYSYDANNEKRLKTYLRGKIAREGSCINIAEKVYLPKLESELSSFDQSVELPYLKTSTETDLSIDVLLNQGHNKEATYADGKILYVDDAQVYNVFDVSSGLDRGVIQRAEIYVDFLKGVHKNKKFNKTEIMCLVNNLTCSGVLFNDSEYKKHINENYTLNNTDFWSLISRKFRTGEANRVLRSTEFRGDIDLSILGEATLSGIQGEKDVRLFFADDLRHQIMPILRLKYKKSMSSSENCK